MNRAHALRALDVAFVVALAATALVQVRVLPEAELAGGRAVHSLLALGFSLPLLARRRSPVAVLAAVLAATLVQYDLGGGLGQPFFAVVVALYAVGAHAGRPATWVGPIAVAALAVWVDVPRLQQGDPWDEVVPAWFVLVGVWALGRWVRHRRFEGELLARRAAAAERDVEERARAAVGAERARIARELHDLVAHNMGVIVLQAQGAQRALEHDPSQVRRALEDIESAGRGGLGEMRRLLDLLVDTGEVASEEPQPTLARLGDLVEGVRSAGADVRLDVTGEARALPPGVEVTAYRIVQEALTNALKHAPGSAVRVTVAHERDALVVSVDDGGARALAVPSGTPRGSGVDSGGRGMVGMRERVALYGGELEAGPRPEGGFSLRARMPLDGRP